MVKTPLPLSPIFYYLNWWVLFQDSGLRLSGPCQRDESNLQLRANSSVGKSCDDLYPEEVLSIVEKVSASIGQFFSFEMLIFHRSAASTARQSQVASSNPELQRMCTETQLDLEHSTIKLMQAKEDVRPWLRCKVQHFLATGEKVLNNSFFHSTILG